MVPGWLSSGPMDHSDARMNLESLLTGHAPADPHEAADRDRFFQLIRTHPDFTSRSLFPPRGPGHATASAVVVSPDLELLLIFHPKLRIWVQPGGHIEPGETDPRVSAARELHEETGLLIPPAAFSLLDLDIHPIPANAKKAEPAHEHFDLRFAARSPTRTLPAEVQDACEAQWFTVDRLPPIDPGVRRMVTKLKEAGMVR